MAPAKKAKRKANNNDYYESHHDEVNASKRSAYAATADATNAARRAKYSVSKAAHVSIIVNETLVT